MVENEYSPDEVTPPGETLRDIIERVGILAIQGPTRRQLRKAVVAVMHKDTPITPDIAQLLQDATGCAASFWLNRERRYRESLKRGEPNESTNI